MDQVSKLLETIITIDDAELQTATPESPKKEKKEAEQAPDPEPAALDDTKAPDPTDRISDFWYLENDQKKLSGQFSDKIIEKVLNVMVDTKIVHPQSIDFRMRVHKTRPPLSINLMSANSTQFAQKTSPAFEMLDAIHFMFSWYNPYLTVGVLLLITLMILHPELASAVPSFLLVKHYLVPSYMKLYMPDPSIVDNKFTFHNPVLHDGLPTGRYEKPKPISQFSREFVMNFTDIQNVMVFYIRIYDFFVNWGQHYFLFEDTSISTVVYLFLLVNMTFNIIALPYVVPLMFKYLPIRAMSIVSVWSFVLMFHPAILPKILNHFDTEEARLRRLDITDRIENVLQSLITEDAVTRDVTKTVEIFELQVLSASKIWKPIGFTSNFHALNDPARSPKPGAPPRAAMAEEVTEDEPGDEDVSMAEDVSMIADEDDANIHIFRKATLDEVRAPRFWKFAEASWQIDLDPILWVNDNLIMDLVFIDTEEKWVYDIVLDESNSDGQVFRRRRWIRQCVRDGNGGKDPKEISMNGGTPSDRLSKTLSTLLS